MTNASTLGTTQRGTAGLPLLAFPYDIEQMSHATNWHFLPTENRKRQVTAKPLCQAFQHATNIALTAATNIAHSASQTTLQWDFTFTVLLKVLHAPVNHQLLCNGLEAVLA
jgi:hypothetical protein